MDRENRLSNKKIKKLCRDARSQVPGLRKKIKKNKKKACKV